MSEQLVGVIGAGSFGTAVSVKPVAIAEDEHAAAVLLKVVHGPNSSISDFVNLSTLVELQIGGQIFRFRVL